MKSSYSSTKNQKLKTNNQITVIIPTLNNIKGLKALLKYFEKTAYPVIIIDNQPTPNKENLITNYPKNQSSNNLIYLPQSKNIGFAEAINRGAEHAKTEWMLILNDDVESPLTTNHQLPITRLLSYATTHHLIAVSPILKNENGDVENYGYRVLPIGRVELITKNQQLSNQESIDGLTAACLLIKTDVFRKLKGFDESFYAYLEDVDLFLRLKEKKYSFGVDASLFVIHYHLTTSKTMGNFKQKQDLVNWWRLIIKHPDVFDLKNPQLWVERLRNLSGLIKSHIK